MKKSISIFLFSLSLVFGVSTAMAATISINPGGDLIGLPGDELTFTIDFEADPAVAFGDAYAFNIGFDASELSLVGWTNDLPGGDWGEFGPQIESGDGKIDNFNRYLNFGVDRPMIQDVQLATVTFNLLPGAGIDGSPDVWFVDVPGLTTIGYIDPGDTLPTYHQVAGITGHEGGDVSAVPIPGAVWLLGSGLIGFVGIGRKKLN